MKIYRVLWRVPRFDPSGPAASMKKIAVFWNTDAEATAHVTSLIECFTKLGYESPASWVAKHSCNPGERFFDE